MNAKPPTAEEVLGLYRFYGTLEFQQFKDAYQQWQAAQGPVTREWFVERFGSTVIYLDDKTAICYIDNGTCILIQDEIEDRSLSNITRSQVETLVRVLGGEDSRVYAI